MKLRQHKHRQHYDRMDARGMSRICYVIHPTHGGRPGLSWRNRDCTAFLHRIKRQYASQQ